jgi:ribonucleoside-triphosphate reductase
VLDETNNLTGGKYDYLTSLALESTKLRKSPAYISSKVMKKLNNGNVFSPMGSNGFLSLYKDENKKYVFEGRFNQGTVTLNLPQMALVSGGDEEKFWNILNERLDICFEALMCKHHALLGTLSNISPIHFQYGAIARLAKDEKIDKLLKNGYSTISLGYIGIYETAKYMKGVSHIENEGKEFALAIMNVLKEKCEKWTYDTGIAFVLYATPSRRIAGRLAKIDRENFGLVKDVTDKDKYNNAYYLDSKERISVDLKINVAKIFEELSNGGVITKLEIEDCGDNSILEESIKKIYENLQYVQIIIKE